jgi:hypothetical protein
MLPPITFLDRLSVAVPDEYRAAARRVADRRGVTVADVIRSALADRLAREGEPVMRLPDLCRHRRETAR